MSVLFSRSRSRINTHSESAEDGGGDPLLRDDTVIHIIDDTYVDIDDKEEGSGITGRSPRKNESGHNLGVPTCARRPSIKSVAGSTHNFTVINYDKEADEAEGDHEIVLPTRAKSPTGLEFPHHWSVTPVPEEKSSKHSKKNKATPWIQKSSSKSRTLSLGEEHVARQAAHNNNVRISNKLYARDKPYKKDGAVDQDKAVRHKDVVTEDAVDQDKADKYSKTYKERWNGSKEYMDTARWGRSFSKRKKNRLVSKSGDYNIDDVNQRKRDRQYMRDLFTTLLELNWAWTLLLLVGSFIISWICFALVYWLISLESIPTRVVILGNYTDVTGNNTDVTGNNTDVTDGVIITIIPEAPVVCIIGVDGFRTALLFSIETQQTIGYGTRAVSDECVCAILFVMFQSVFGVVMQCVLTGLVFARLARSNKRGETIMFSKNAVICRHRGHLCLMFQFADMRKARMIGVSLNAIMIQQKKIAEGETDIYQSMRQYKLEVHTDADDQFFLALPVRVVHRIDKKSPLYNLSPDQLVIEDFEIVVVLEGVNESSGQSVQVRTSYLPGEIMWGHKHGPLITNQRKNGTYKIDYARFNEVLPVDTPEMSARDMGPLAHQRSTVPDKLYQRDMSAPFYTSLAAVAESSSEDDHSDHNANDTEDDDACALDALSTTNVLP